VYALCDAVEDMHHVFVDCWRYTDPRERAGTELESRTSAKLAEFGVEEAARKCLLGTAKSLSRKDDSFWPLKFSFYYLGHLPPP